MDETKLVSVVVPVYEVEPYIEECLDSIVSQTLERIEVILILKEGRDASCNIARYYADKHGWKTLSVREHQMQGESRNLGIDAATGKYIVFADSDDVVPENAYELMSSALEKTLADACIGRTLRFHSKNKKGWRIRNFDSTGIFDSRRVLTWSDCPNLAYNGGPWNKMIRTNYLRDHGIRFPENVLYEDVGFSLDLYSSGAKFVTEPSVVYKWRVRLAGSASVTQQRDDIKNLLDRISVYQKVDSILSQRGIEGELLSSWQERKAHDILYYLDNYLDGTEYYRNIFQERVPEFLRTVPQRILDALPRRRAHFASLIRKEQWGRLNRDGGAISLLKVLRGAVSATKVGGRGVRRLALIVTWPFRAIDRSIKDVKRLVRRRRWQHLLHPVHGLTYGVFRRLYKPSGDVFLYEGVSGRQYAGNEKYIYAKMRERFPKSEHVWVFQDKKAIERNKERLKGATLVVRGSVKYVRKLAQAGAVFTGTSLPYYYQKREKSLFIQSWHGTPVKLLGFDIKFPEARALNRNSTENMMFSQSRKWTAFVAPNEFTADKFSRAFLYDGEIIRSGYPRNDIFYWDAEKRADIVQDVRLKLNIPNNKKIALYAPTFRDGKTFGTRKTVVNFPIDIRSLKRFLHEDWVLIVRAHLLSGGVFNAGKYGDFVRTAMVDEFDDPQELCLAADALITDYSSIAFDYANTGKPMIFFTPDIDDYGASRRGFYFDPRDEFPGPFFDKTEDVAKALLSLPSLQAEYGYKYKEFVSKYCSWEDGAASQRVVNKVIDDLNDSKLN